jgi:hypothetical protein
MFSFIDLLFQVALGIFMAASLFTTKPIFSLPVTIAAMDDRRNSKASSPEIRN